MAGEIDTSLSIDALASALARQGVRLQVRESCHYVGGRYIRVGEGVPEFTLESIPGEFLARAAAASVEQMRSAVDRLSATLAAVSIRHRFEFYDVQSNLAGYLHYNWPENK
jgi:hypothetical protein